MTLGKQIKKLKGSWDENCKTKRDMLIFQLRKERLSQGLSQNNLGLLIETSHSLVSRVEAKKGDVSLLNFIKLADALGFDLVLKKQKE